MEEWAAYCLKWAEKKVVTHNRGFEVSTVAKLMEDTHLNNKNRLG